MFVHKVMPRHTVRSELHRILVNTKKKNLLVLIRESILEIYEEILVKFRVMN